MDCSLPVSSVHGILRQEYWSALLLPSRGDLPNPGIKPTSPVSPALTSGFFTTTPPEKPLRLFFHYMAKGIHNGITLLINRPSNRVVLWMGLT